MKILNKIKDAFSSWSKSDLIALVAVIISGIGLFKGCDVDNRIDVMEPKFNQVINLEPKIENTIQTVTKVEKEIANINEAMHQYFNSTKTEIFDKKDLDKRIKMFPHPSSENNKYIIYFELEKIPEKNSVDISSGYGKSSPATFTTLNNIVCYRFTKGGKEFLSQKDDFIAIRYYPNFTTKNSLLTLENMQYKGTIDNVCQSIQNIRK